MTIYIDSDNHCHTANPEGIFREVETDFFDGKCAAFVEGYCYETDSGCPRIYPFKPHDGLEAAQRQYEREKLADAENALAILLGGETL